MPGTDRRTWWTGRACIAAALLFTLVAAGCSSGGTFGGPTAAAPPSPDSSGAAGDRIANFFSGSSAKAPQPVANAQPEVTCPRVDVRQGASTLTIGPPGDKAAMSVRYQGSFIREARECAVVGGNMVMKIGVEGRVIVGPAGGPGQIDVPLRIAVVQETPGGGRPIVTKFIRVPVALGPNNGNVPFTHIEEGLTFPLPTPTTALYDYIAYVGFDPLSAETQDRQSPKPKPRPKPAASAN